MTKKHPLSFTGIKGSRGTAVAKAYVFRKRIEVRKRHLKPNQVKSEIDRLNRALTLTRKDITQARKRALSTQGEKYAAIFDTHLLMLEDSQIIPEIIKRIEKQKFNAESIVRERIDEIQRKFAAIEDPYMKERAVDIKDIGRRLLRHLMGIEGPARDVSDEPYILIAEEITPGEMLDFARSKLKGVCLDTGGATSHVAILAGALSIPSVFGLGNISVAAKTGDMVLIDTRKEPKVILNPEEKKIESLQKSEQKKQNELNLSDLTADNKKIQLAANISRPEELAKISELNIKKIGLYRSEFIFMQNSEIPSELEQFECYSKVIKAAPEMTVFRTIDVGSDKPLKNVTITPEENPAMGFRSVRFSLSRPDIIIPQLKAMIRASVFGKCKIIFPMISTINELETVKDVYNQAILEADIKQPAPEWGIMLEVPSCLYMMQEISNYTKYISLGTNDLLQFFYAIDRTNNKLASYASYLNKPFIRFICDCIKQAHKYDIKIGVCGEMASHPAGFLTLLALGIDELSMKPDALEEIMAIIPQIKISKLKKLISELLKNDKKNDIKGEIIKVFPHLAELVW